MPADFDPDAIDLVTGKAQEPIMQFDELIVGLTAESVARGQGGAPGFPTHKTHVDEIEIYEYRLMKEQLRRLKARFPDEAKIDRLSYPAVAGHEVITCDNTRYSPSHPDDKDRSGLVYSVPFYGVDGKFRGMPALGLSEGQIDQLVADSEVSAVRMVDLSPTGRVDRRR